MWVEPSSTSARSPSAKFSVAAASRTDRPAARQPPLIPRPGCAGSGPLVAMPPVLMIVLEADVGDAALGEAEVNAPRARDAAASGRGSGP